MEIPLHKYLTYLEIPVSVAICWMQHNMIYIPERIFGTLLFFKKITAFTSREEEQKEKQVGGC